MGEPPMPLKNMGEPPMPLKNMGEPPMPLQQAARYTESLSAPGIRH
jgi:hypothetical protein